MNTFDQTQLADPVQVLPKENLLQIFSYLSQRDIERSARVSKDWKSFIESDFSLFTTVVIKTDKSNRRRFKLEDIWGLEDEEKEEKMNKAVNSLSRFARLSTNRLKDVSIGMAAFIGSMPKSVGAFEYSRLPELFNILHLSSASLERLCLEIPELPVNEYTAVALSSQIMVITSKLELFPNLKEAELKASLLFEITYKSQAKTFKIVPYCPYPLPESHPYYCNYGYEDSQRGMEVPFVRILKSMKDWTNGELTHLIGMGSEWNLASTIHSSFVGDELLRSTISLEAVHLGRVDHDDTEDADEDDVFDVVSRSPNLTSFEFQGSRPLRPWIVDLPSESSQVSKLKTLDIDAWIRVEWNRGIVKWIGEEVETISLRNIQLIGDVTSPFFLPALKERTLSGDIDLLNLFASQLHYPSLTSLSLHHNKLFEPDQMDKIVDFVGASASSLESLQLSEEFDLRNDEAPAYDKPQETRSFDFPLLEHLHLELLSDTLIEIFSRSHYPNIEEVFLPSKLKLRKILP